MVDRVAKQSKVLLLTDPVLSVTNLELRALGARRFNTVTDLGECACLLCRAKSKRLCNAIKELAEQDADNGEWVNIFDENGDTRDFSYCRL